MKTLFAALILLFSPSAFAEEEEVCTAIVENLDGQELWVRVECDGAYAGKCLKEIVLKDGTQGWQEVACK